MRDEYLNSGKIGTVDGEQMDANRDRAPNDIAANGGAGTGTVRISHEINLDGAGTGRIFGGVGAISGGGRNLRLLINYPAKQRNEIPDHLFKPGYGPSLQILKLEIGGDANSPDAAEPGIEHIRGIVNCNTGYEFWLAEEAKRRNPK